MFISVTDCIKIWFKIKYYIISCQQILYFLPHHSTLIACALFLSVTALAPEGCSTLNLNGDLGRSTPLKVMWRRWGPVSRGFTAISRAPEIQR